jgi:hypothetical protein
VVADIYHVLSKEENIVLYPNPVSGIITIQNLTVTNGASFNISIYNMLGEQVYTVVDFLPTKGELATVNCQLFPSGFYWLEVKNADIIYRSKFIKK